MIKFNLICKNDHEFEGWFSSSSEFDRLKDAGHLTCAVCGDANVAKALMAPSVQTSRKKAAAVQTEVAQHLPEPSKSQDVQMAAGSVAGALDAVPAEVREKFVKELRALKKHVAENAENVGDKFPEEARKIHYGEAEARGIYGKANPKEAAEMLEEGIEFLPLPDLPEEQN